jgi:DNA polymerase-3 subunit beta
VKGDAQGLEIGFNNRYVLDALRAAPTDELLLQLSSPTSPCVILPASGDGSFLYLILPVRIRTGE